MRFMQARLEWRQPPTTSSWSTRGARRRRLTLDADFHALLPLSNALFPSVVRIRVEGLRGEQLAELIERVISLCKADLLAGAMVTVDDRSVRVRALPLVRQIVAERYEDPKRTRSGRPRRSVLRPGAHDRLTRVESPPQLHGVCTLHTAALR